MVRVVTVTSSPSFEVASSPHDLFYELCAVDVSHMLTGRDVVAFRALDQSVLS